MARKKALQVLDKRTKRQARFEELKAAQKTISMVKITKIKCRHCGHQWIPRTAKPVQCPMCHRVHPLEIK